MRFEGSDILVGEIRIGPDGVRKNVNVITCGARIIRLTSYIVENLPIECPRQDGVLLHQVEGCILGAIRRGGGQRRRR